MQQLRAVATGRIALHQRLVAVLHHATHRRRRLALADHEVHDCRQRVHVGPRALLHARHVGVLLDRRIAWLENHRQCVRHVADDTPRRAEVEQHGALIGKQHDVVGRDVAVVDMIPVDDGQGVHEGRQDLAYPGFVGRVVAQLENVMQGLAAEVRHDHVGRAVRLPEAVHLDQRGVIELGEHARFVDEAAQADLEGRAIALRSYRHRSVVPARSEQGRHVLLQRHLAMQRVVLGEIDDAEATFTDQIDDLELAEHRADRQRVRMQTRRRGLGCGNADQLGAGVGAVVIHSVIPSRKPLRSADRRHQRSHASLNQLRMSVAGMTLPAYFSMLGSNLQAWLPVQL